MFSIYWCILQELRDLLGEYLNVENSGSNSSEMIVCMVALINWCYT